MAEKRVWIEGGNVELAEAPMDYIGQGSERIWIEGGNLFVDGGGGGGFTFEGEWDVGTAYTTGQIVRYDNSLYQAKQDTTGDTPPANAPGVYAPLLEFTPTVPVNAEAGDIEIGIRFLVDQTCTATASYFYKGDATNGGTHVGRVWNGSTATQLDSENYTGETASGWQRQAFATPVTLNPGTIYVHSVTLPQAHYSNTPNLMSLAPFMDGPVRVGVSLFNGTPGSMPDTAFQDFLYFNTIEVTVADDPNWELLAKGEWGVVA